MFDKILSIIFSKKALIILAVLSLFVICFAVTGCGCLVDLAGSCGSVADCYCNNCDFLFCLFDCGEFCSFEEGIKTCTKEEIEKSDCALLKWNCFTECNRCEETGCYGTCDAMFKGCYNCSDSICKNCGYEEGCFGFCYDCAKSCEDSNKKDSK